MITPQAGFKGIVLNDRVKHCLICGTLPIVVTVASQPPSHPRSRVILGANKMDRTRAGEKTIADP